MDNKLLALLVEEKKALLKRITEQMADDLQNNKLSNRALDCFKLVQFNLDAIKAQLQLNTEQGYSNALQLLWRAGCNLGEFMALKPEKRKKDEHDGHEYG